MPDTARPEGEEVVDESVSHYLVQKLKNGKVRVRAGGHVVTAETYWKALERLASSEQERLEEKPDHLKDDQWDSIYWNVTDPRLEDVIQPDEEHRRDNVLDTVHNGPARVAKDGAWLALLEEEGIEDLGDRVDLYRLWDTEYTEMTKR